MFRRVVIVACLAMAGAAGCASGGEVCRDNGVVVKCREVGSGPIERCHRNWRGALVCRVR